MSEGAPGGAQRIDAGKPILANHPPFHAAGVSEPRADPAYAFDAGRIIQTRQEPRCAIAAKGSLNIANLLGVAKEAQSAADEIVRLPATLARSGERSTKLTIAEVPRRALKLFARVTGLGGRHTDFVAEVTNETAGAMGFTAALLAGAHRRRHTHAGAAGFVLGAFEVTAAAAHTAAVCLELAGETQTSRPHDAWVAIRSGGNDGEATTTLDRRQSSLEADGYEGLFVKCAKARFR